MMNSTTPPTDPALENPYIDVCANDHIRLCRCIPFVICVCLKCFSVIFPFFEIYYGSSHW